MYTKLTSSLINSSLHSQNKDTVPVSACSSKTHTHTHTHTHTPYPSQTLIRDIPLYIQISYTSPLLLSYTHITPYIDNYIYITTNYQPISQSKIYNHIQETIIQNFISNNVYARRNMVVLRMRREERAAQGQWRHYLCEAGMLSCKCHNAIGWWCGD
jgi:hypothetical protein